MFHPGDPKTFNFAHSYVSVSRCQCCGVMKDYSDYNTLTILGPLSQLHFNRQQKSIEMVKAEYRRFEIISNNNILNIMYDEQNESCLNFKIYILINKIYDYICLL